MRVLSCRAAIVVVISALFCSGVFGYNPNAALEYSSTWCNAGDSFDYGYNVAQYNSVEEQLKNKTNPKYRFVDDEWHHSTNGWYQDFSSISSDCANFVSQCLIAGGINYADLINGVNLKKKLHRALTQDFVEKNHNKIKRFSYLLIN